MRAVPWFAFVVLNSILAACAPGTAADPGAVTMAIESPPTNLDPRIGQDATSQRLTELIFNSLVRLNEKAEIVGDLAQRWETPDSKTYVFYLRDDVQFHDGRPLTSRDVKFTFTSMFDGTVRTIKSGHPYNLIDTIDTPDRYTVVFRLKEAFSPFLSNFTGGVIGIVPEGSSGNFSARPIGSGPFEFVRYLQDEEVVLKRNESYFGDKAKVGILRFKVIPEAIVRALELQKGSIDIALNVLPADMVEVLKKYDNLNITEEDGTNYQYLAFNLKDPVFSDVRVRQAFAYGIDREKIVKYVWRDHARLAVGVLPPNNWAYEPNLNSYPYDPRRARELLKEAGYENLMFTFRSSTEETSKLLAAVLQQQLKDIGVTMEIRSNEFATFFADVIAGNFQAYSARWIGANNDPDMFNLIFHSKSVPPNGANRGRYSNPRVDELVEFARREIDVEKRKQAYHEIQRIVSEELPYISIFYLDNTCVSNKRIEGIRLSPSGDYTFLGEIRINSGN